MTSTIQTLCAIEARAERAIVQELRLMMQDILAIRTALVLQERSHADALLMKLDRLATDQQASPVPAAIETTSPVPGLHLDSQSDFEPRTYRVSLYDHEYGTLEDVVAVESFAIGVQLVIDRLDTSTDHIVDATWNQGHGKLTVTTLGGCVLACVEVAAAPAEIVVHPAVFRACHALQSGDSSRIDHLFGLALLAA